MLNESEVKANLKDIIVDRLGVEADLLENDTPLFGDSPIGLDSIDSLEIISAVDSEYGVNMAGVGKEHFYNIDALAKFICAHAE